LYAYNMGAAMLKKIVWSVLAVVWGTTWLAITIGLRDLPPLTFAGLRFSLAGLILWGFLAIRGVRLPESRAEWSLVFRTGTLIFVVSYALQFWAMQFVTSGMTSVIFSTVPAFTLVIGHFVVRDERLTAAGIAGVFLGIMGVGLIFSDQIVFDNRMTFFGCIASLAAAFGMARAQVDIRAFGQKLDPATVAAIQMTFGGIALLSAGAIVEGNPFALDWTTGAVVSLVYLAAVGSAFGFLAFYWLLQRIPVAKASAMMLIHPVVAISLGVVFLNETLSGFMVAGAAVIVGGLALILRPSSPVRKYVGETAITGQHRVVCEIQ
jgi:drug/metabolite transporter (DMT)-like permease